MDSEPSFLGGSRGYAGPPPAVETAGSAAKSLLLAWEPRDQPSWTGASHAVTPSPDTHGRPRCHQTCDRDTVQHAPEGDGSLRHSDKAVLFHAGRNWRSVWAQLLVT